MKSLFVIATLVALLGSIGCPPVTKDKEKEEDSKEDMQFGLEYERYLKEVVSTLETDDEFRRKLEQSNISDIKSGNIAEHLEFVSHNIRNKLDELKRKEVDRLNQIKKLLIQREQGVDPETMDHKKLVSHIDELNADTFEVEDLRKLIRQATSDLEDIDKKRRDDFKTYELEKEALRRQKLKQMDERHRKEEEQRFEEMQKKHKEHPKLHHPGNKAQLEEVWEEDDDLDPEDFNAKTMFNLHDTDGNGVLDEQEVEALFQRELDKVYDPNAPEDDLMERYEEMNRMREHVMKEVDANQDKLISLEEFLKSTQDEEFNKDEGWDTLEEDPQFTEEELNEYLREREEKRRQQFEGHAQPGEINMPPAHDNLQFGQQQQQQQDNVQWYVVASDDRVKRGAEVAALLLKYNTNVDLQDLDGFTALHTICTKPCIENYLSMFEAVLKAGGDIHIKEKHGHPPLLTAVCFYNTEFVKILVKHYSPTRLSEKFALTNDIEDSVDYKSALLLAAERVEDLERQLRECYKVITLLIMGGHKIHADVFTIMRQCANFNFLYFPEMFEVIKKYRNNPRSLKDIARLEVRNAMPYPCPSNIAKLPLPLKIQKYVELEDLDNVDKDVDDYIKETAEIREAREIEHSKRHFSTYVIRD